jgi:hypothetical protein
VQQRNWNCFILLRYFFRNFFTKTINWWNGRNNPICHLSDYSLVVSRVQPLSAVGTYGLASFNWTGRLLLWLNGQPVDCRSTLRRMQIVIRFNWLRHICFDVQFDLILVVQYFAKRAFEDWHTHTDKCANRVVADRWIFECMQTLHVVSTAVIFSCIFIAVLFISLLIINREIIFYFISRLPTILLFNTRHEADVRVYWSLRSFQNEVNISISLKPLVRVFDSSKLSCNTG